MSAVITEADAADDVLRVSMDAKATVKVGPFARGGRVAPGSRRLTTTFIRPRPSPQWGSSCPRPTISSSTG